MEVSTFTNIVVCVVCYTNKETRYGEILKAIKVQTLFVFLSDSGGFFPVSFFNVALHFCWEVHHSGNLF